MLSIYSLWSWLWFRYLASLLLFGPLLPFRRLVGFALFLNFSGILSQFRELGIGQKMNVVQAIGVGKMLILTQEEFTDRKWILTCMKSVIISIVPFLTACFGLFYSPYGWEQLPFNAILFVWWILSWHFVELDLTVMGYRKWNHVDSRIWLWGLRVIVIGWWWPKRQCIDQDANIFYIWILRHCPERLELLILVKWRICVLMISNFLFKPN